MNETMLLQIAVSTAGAALLVSVVCAAIALSARGRLRSAAALADALKEGFVEKTAELKELSRRNEELARRVARLETRSKAEPEPEAEVDETPRRLTITERRHRVLTLSKRGQSSGTIASMLGIPVGEVELIIDLNRAA